MADFARYTVLNWNYIQMKNFQIFHDRFFFVNYFLSFFAQMKTKIYLGQTK